MNDFSARDVVVLLDDLRRRPDATPGVIAAIERLAAQVMEVLNRAPVAPEVHVEPAQIHVPEVDTAAIGVAVQQAISDVAGVNQAFVSAIDAKLEALTEAIGKMPRSTTRMGGGGPSQLKDSSGVIINPATEETLQNVANAVGASTETETRLDYDGRTDGNPVYVGKADQGTAVSAGTWKLQKLEYDSDDRLTRVQELHDKRWDTRATAGWS